MIFTDFKNRLYKAVFTTDSGDNGTLPTGYKLGLSSTAPKADGSNITEPLNGDYDRKELTFALVGGVVANNSEVDYGDVVSSWGTLTHAVIYDQDDNLVMSGPLTAAITVNSGDPLVVRPYGITITITDD